MLSFTKPEYSLRALILTALVVIGMTIFVYHLCEMRSASQLAAHANGFGLPQVIDELRAEMAETQTRRIETNAPALFQIQTVDVELQVVAKNTDTAGGKVELEVVTPEMKHELSNELTHKLTLHMAFVPKIVMQSFSEDKNLKTDDAIEIP